MSYAEYKSFIEGIPQEDVDHVIHLLTLRQKTTTYVPLTVHEQMLNQQKRTAACWICQDRHDHELIWSGRCLICDGLFEEDEEDDEDEEDEEDEEGEEGEEDEEGEEGEEDKGKGSNIRHLADGKELVVCY